MLRRTFASLLLGAPLAAFAHDHEKAGAKDAITKFKCCPFAAAGITHPIYVAGSGPAVLLLHELPGLMPEDIAFALQLSDRYTVYLPLMFGKPGEGDSWFRGEFLRVVLRTPCWGSEFHCASTTSIGAIVGWLSKLCLDIDKRQKGGGLAVIGNCLTGSVPLALMADDEVRPKLRCSVLSQPAVPLGPFPFPKQLTFDGRIAVGLTPEQLNKAANSRVPTLAFRFIDDPLVPQERLEALVTLFPRDPNMFEFYPVFPDFNCRKWAGKGHNHHSVLTVDTCTDSGSNGEKAREKLYSFLSKHLEQPATSSQKAP